MKLEAIDKYLTLIFFTFLFIKVSYCLIRYDKALQIYDEILEDDETNAVRFHFSF